MAAAAAQTTPASRKSTGETAVRDAAYPRVFEGRHLAMIAFPLGGVGAGSVALGGRGQLRDWEMFNRPNKGFRPSYVLPSIWAQVGSGKPVVRVLESRLIPPFEGQNGLGSDNAPGLARLASARFTGEFPLARIDFEDRELPVRVSLEAFTPFIPLDAEDSGLPVAILRYRVSNPNHAAAKVSIAFAIDNPVRDPAQPRNEDTRRNARREGGGLTGIIMSNSKIAAEHPMNGEIALCIADPETAQVTSLAGWAQSRWWNAPLLYWDDFSDDGQLGPDPSPHNWIASLCAQRQIAAGESAEFTYVLAWRFPNRTPDWSGWHAPKGDEHTVIGNHYCERFKSAWDAAEYATTNLARLEKETRLFAATLGESTLPAAVKEAASANLSTLVTTTCFRTADGEFHGFEGSNDTRGCCHGNCTHVWNYETSTALLFPTLARSLRKAAFGYSMDDAGAMHFRQSLPDGKDRSGFAAADGQMGQIMHAYLDWVLEGDDAWMKELWPRIKKAIEFSWMPGGWDANRDGVMEGVQHNTYDVEFYGPNPLCGVYYLGALRAAEEMARAAGDTNAASEYRRLFESGRQWTDANLFNGEYFVQKIRGFKKDEIAASLRSTMGSDDTENPQYQAGDGCLVDQLLGQYLADVAGLGPLLDSGHIQKTAASIYRYNYKRSLVDHDNVQRTFVLNDEAALIICDYGKAQRPRIPFPYFAEAFTGSEYSAAVLMLYHGLAKEGVECITSIRARYDGEKRNPWDEAECGHHYARAMSAWSGVVALSGFRYDGRTSAIEALPRVNAANFRCFWSAGTGWGTFAVSRNGISVKVLKGKLACRSADFRGSGGKSAATLSGKAVASKATVRNGVTRVEFDQAVTINEGDELRVEV
jgi:non-lysosomal glucosylceramidase